METMAPELKEVLKKTGHRPYPMPEGPWVLRMSWLDLLFIHWPVRSCSNRSSSSSLCSNLQE